MQETLNDRDDNEEMMMEDRETQKKMVHPYRKYQLWILVMIIISIILGIISFNLNSELNTLLKTEQNLFSQVTDLKEESQEIQKVYERVDVNYKDIYGLDKKKNIDIIHNLEELNKLSLAINERGSVSYSICYKATVDGDSPDTFRKLCGNTSPTLFLIETVDGYRFGAFTNLHFGEEVESSGYREDAQAFIFSFDTGKKYKIEQAEYAVSDTKGSFPSFGRRDIVLGKNILSGASPYIYPCPSNIYINKKLSQAITDCHYLDITESESEIKLIWNNNNIKSTKGMFHNCKDIIEIDMTKFDTSLVTDMSYMFALCQSLKSLNVII